MAPNFLRLFARSYQDTTLWEYAWRLSCSWLIRPWFHFVLRAIISIYAFAVLSVRIGIETTSGKTQAAQRSFSFFTVLGYWGIAFYFAAAAVHTASYAARGKSWLETWPAPLRFLHSALYMTVTVYPFVVTAVFWGVLSEGAFRSEFSTWSNISQHALNSVFALLEIVLPLSDPHPWILLVPLIVLLALYLGLAYLTHTTQHFYVYSFLNPNIGRGIVAGACIGILVGSIIVFIIVRYLMVLRRWTLGLSPKQQHQATLARSQKSGGEMEMVSTKSTTLDKQDV